MSTATAPKGFSLEEDRGVLVVTLFWESIVKETALDELRERVVEQLPQATTAVLFDCRKLTGPATSQFLATLVSVRKAAMREGLFVCVTNLTGPVREAYAVSRLDRIIPIYHDRETAIRAVGDYGIGRIAVGKVEPDRLGAGATDKDDAHDRGSSATAAIAGQATAAIVSATDSLTGMRDNLRTASYSLSRGQMLQLGGIAAALLLLAGLAWYFLAPPRANAAATTSDDRPVIFGGEARSTLAGDVYVRHGENQHPDAGAIVLAWRAGNAPPQKVLTKTIYRYLNETGASEEFPHPWMHAARASETGKFRIGIDEPGELEVLIISASSQRSPTLSSADEQALAAWFEEPRTLIGKHPYRVVRQKMDAGEVALSEVFQRSASR